jgi:hypothetical protein
LLSISKLGWICPSARAGQYETLAEIAAGGMGVIWRATDTTLGRKGTVKVLQRHVERYRKGERPPLSEYIHRHPKWERDWGKGFYSTSQSPPPTFPSGTVPDRAVFSAFRTAISRALKKEHGGNRHRLVARRPAYPSRRAE